jgi:hypothetical protein
MGGPYAGAAVIEPVVGMVMRLPLLPLQMLSAKILPLSATSPADTNKIFFIIFTPPDFFTRIDTSSRTSKYECGRTRTLKSLAQKLGREKPLVPIFFSLEAH